MTGQLRSVERVIEPQPVVEGAGVHLVRSIATRELNYLDPFLLFDDFGSENPDDYLQGFPWHPHRGIETVTYVLGGRVRHGDSLGNAGSIGAGDVQWMTAGSGIMHEEMPELGEESLVGFQLWVNLPASLKMMQPRYQDIPASLVPEIERDDGVTIRVIAGEVDGVVGPVSDIAAQPAYLDVRLSAGSKTDLPVQAGQSAFAYVFEGEGMFGAGASATDVPGPKMVVFGDGDRVEATAGQAGARFLLVAGQPLHEPIARYGPFVMNTREEIEQALRDLREGTFIREQPASEPDQWYGLRAQPS